MSIDFLISTKEIASNPLKMRQTLVYCLFYTVSTITGQRLVMTAPIPSRSCAVATAGSTKSPQKATGFSFKQFHIDHDKCAMKVGTDGILLGAWAPLTGPMKILDIGTGSGLIALMLAQRANKDGSLIDAIDIEGDAVIQAKQNVANSPWPAQINCFSQSLHTFAGEAARQQDYHLIVSNPPYFESGQQLACQARQTARLTDELDHITLCHLAMGLLKEQGSLCLVLPHQAAMVLLQQLTHNAGLMVPNRAGQAAGDTPCAWHLLAQVDVYTKNTPQQMAHRCLLQLQKRPLSAAPSLTNTQPSSLFIHADGGGYSAQFIALTQAFYLKM
ncbi:tRNA1(Val) (adenine(37)-N6)-methyltransferase [Motilimonas pumila]|uniref:tRNA1(Val) (adenine(37)-N6)-methyltransferase n=1 Tax=Motilimonas pumila TaxID=2303987 RepID=A0A418YAH0_9GAMM|nr:methyltransferase [Motilimonas pumila]RJG39529.1 methyltransferase domain-containing protein [Motilimonas pumila]